MIVVEKEKAPEGPRDNAAILSEILIELKNISEYVDYKKAQAVMNVNRRYAWSKKSRDGIDPKPKYSTFQEVLQACRQCLKE